MYLTLKSGLLLLVCELLFFQPSYTQTNSIAGNLSIKLFYPAFEQQLTSYSFSDSTQQQNIITNDKVNYSRLAIACGALAGGITFIHIYQQNGWWKDNRAPFHFREDVTYGLSVDKIGHFYGATALAFVMSKTLLWANLSEESAIWYGAGGALLFQTYVEIEDGFSTWGFDRLDFASDVAGSAWPVVQYYVPFLYNFDWKLSYHPSDLLDRPGGTGFKGQQHIIFDDYEGQTLWLSFKIHGLLPYSAKSYWPSFLNIAYGYGAREVGGAGVNPYHVHFLALDLDMTKIIPDNTPFLKTLGQALNFIHFPLPAVRIYPNVAVYGHYF